MPTYICTAPAELLDDEARKRLAAGITRVHERVTGADGFLAQVLFRELPAGRHFVAGEPAVEPPLYLHGHIRAGRSELVRERLLQVLVEVVADAAPLPIERVWVYLSELPHGQMAEYGRALPAPGDEAAWLAALPPGLRRRLGGGAGSD